MGIIVSRPDAQAVAAPASAAGACAAMATVAGMHISVIGCGYLGAVHAACLAGAGHEVVGLDVDARKVAGLQAGEPLFHEPGLAGLLGRTVGHGLRFTTDPGTLGAAEVIYLAVGTPQLGDGQVGAGHGGTGPAGSGPVGNGRATGNPAPDGSGAQGPVAAGRADLSQLDAALRQVEAHASRTHRTLVVGKSTVPVGTAARVAERLSRCDADLVVAWEPEFVREGHAIADTRAPARLVHGLPDDPEQARFARSQLARCHRGIDAATPRLAVDYATAELVKTSANAFLATKISFINAMAELCDAAGADVTALADALGLDPRIGAGFLDAGIGFGGGCLPKDLRALQARAGELGAQPVADLLGRVDALNLRARDRATDALARLCGGGLAGRRVAILGAAFKPDSDDLRDSPALGIADRARAAGARVTITDPMATGGLRCLRADLEVVDDTLTAATDADVVALLTPWPHYLRLDPAELGEVVAHKALLDGRNALDPDEWKRAGWRYAGMGRR
ncbi:UDP-glucose 6-dehydrogenase udgA [Propionibacterium freudenreichii]|nr:UDP-glucose 6-dehydrogenase udgA [Propionibacterium freudenreichii]SCQ81499.1 UDP-glucose 6-dehydrogenase udgA [Propionibacterium freudenreichii]